MTFRWFPPHPRVLRVGDDKAGAVFSQEREHRYVLWRSWSSVEYRVYRSKGHVAFCMLNPSIADEKRLDPTLRRCKRFAQDWGYDGMVIINLYPLVSTSPDGLRHTNPMGDWNESHLDLVAHRTTQFIVAWGASKYVVDRGKRVVHLLKQWEIDPMCLAHTKDGHPRHPLYVRKDTTPIAYGR